MKDGSVGWHQCQGDHWREIIQQTSNGGEVNKCRKEKNGHWERDSCSWSISSTYRLVQAVAWTTDAISLTSRTPDKAQAEKIALFSNIVMVVVTSYKE